MRRILYALIPSAEDASIMSITLRELVIVLCLTLGAYFLCVGKNLPLRALRVGGRVSWVLYSTWYVELAQQVRGERTMR